MISVLEDWFAAQTWLTPVPTSGPPLPDRLYYCTFESQRKKAVGSAENKLASPAKRPRKRTTTPKDRVKAQKKNSAATLATSTFATAETTASAYAYNTVQLAPRIETSARAQPKASSPTDDENHQVRLSTSSTKAFWAHLNNQLPLPPTRTLPGPSTRPHLLRMDLTIR